MRAVHGWLTLVWIALIPASFITGWIDSLRFVSLLSLVALALASAAAWQATRTEVKQDEQGQEETEPQ